MQVRHQNLGKPRSPCTFKGALSWQGSLERRRFIDQNINCAEKARAAVAAPKHCAPVEKSLRLSEIRILHEKETLSAATASGSAGTYTHASDLNERLPSCFKTLQPISCADCAYINSNPNSKVVHTRQPRSRRPALIQKCFRN